MGEFANAHIMTNFFFPREDRAGRFHASQQRLRWRLFPLETLELHQNHEASVPFEDKHCGGVGGYKYMPWV